MTDKVQKIREKIKVVINRRLNLLNGDYFELNKETDGFTNEIIDIVDSLQEEPVSEDLEEAVNAYIGYAPEVDESSSVYGKRQAFKVGAKWQKTNLWKPADGDDLPEIDREVVAFQETFPTDVDVPSLLKIVIAHRPNPEGYDGKSITTGQIERYTPKTYDKGGWNIPNIVYWLDAELPKEIEL